MHRVMTMHRAVYCCAGGLLVLNSIPQVFPDISEYNIYGLPRMQATREQVDNVRAIARHMELVNPDRIQVYVSSGLSSLSYGTTSLPNGARVGLSRVVLYGGPEDVMNSKITLRDELIDWDSPEGQALMKLLPPSQNEVKFRIAHEIAHLKRNDVFSSVLLSPLILVTGYLLAVFFCKHVFTARSPLAFSFLFSMVVFIYADIDNRIRRWQEYRADRCAAFCGKSCAEGGVQMMKKHMNMDALLGGNKKFNFFDKNFSFITNLQNTHPPFSERLKRLENILALYK